jgi:hypothetical protein
MAAMNFNRGEIEYAIESPDGEMGVSVPYGELANHEYGGHVYIAYCDDPESGDTQIYRLAGPTLLSGLELVETVVADTEFGEDGEAGDGEESDDETVEVTDDGGDDDDADDADDDDADDDANADADEDAVK